MESFDVIIPTGKNILDSNYSICYTIRSILHQQLQPNKIIVVFNTINTGIEQELKDKFGHLVTVVDGTLKGPNIAFARNIGVQNSNSDILMFIDDDVVLGYHDHFSRIINIMKYNDFCCGAKRYWTSSKWADYLSMDYPINHILQLLKSKSYLPLSIDRDTGKRKLSEYTYIGNLGAIRRSVFDSMHGFDEQYAGWAYQDTDLMMRLCYHRYKYEILSYSGIFCYHLGHPADKSRYQQTNRARYIKKQAEMEAHFCLSNFFGRFDEEEYTYDIFLPIPK